MTTFFRRRLMTSQFIEEFSFLLDSGRDGIEVSYNAAGVLATSPVTEPRCGA